MDKHLSAKIHARNAKARASQMFEAGKLSKKDRDEVFREADVVLRGKGH